jgi:hypothetical protein
MKTTPKWAAQSVAVTVKISSQNTDAFLSQKPSSAL